ncbi:MAG: hypothetical protein EBS38_01255 [Actinobacteria bacterium]|nr:hypothetical protein [Actinomycetota bacterium]
MPTLEELYDQELKQERFAMLVAARVNDILAGTARTLAFTPAGGTFYTEEQLHLMFADKIAQAVCANLHRED